MKEIFLCLFLYGSSVAQHGFDELRSTSGVGGRDPDGGFIDSLPTRHSGDLRRSPWENFPRNSWRENTDFVDRRSDLNPRKQRRRNNLNKLKSSLRSRNRRVRVRRPFLNSQFIKRSHRRRTYMPAIKKPRFTPRIRDVLPRRMPSYSPTVRGVWRNWESRSSSNGDIPLPTSESSYFEMTDPVSDKSYLSRRNRKTSSLDESLVSEIIPSSLDGGVKPISKPRGKKLSYADLLAKKKSQSYITPENKKKPDKSYVDTVDMSIPVDPSSSFNGGDKPSSKTRVKNLSYADLLAKKHKPSYVAQKNKKASDPTYVDQIDKIKTDSTYIDSVDKKTTKKGHIDTGVQSNLEHLSDPAGFPILPKTDPNYIQEKDFLSINTPGNPLSIDSVPPETHISPNQPIPSDPLRDLPSNAFEIPSSPNVDQVPLETPIFSDKRNRGKKNKNNRPSTKPIPSDPFGDLLRNPFEIPPEPSLGKDKRGKKGKKNIPSMEHLLSDPFGDLSPNPFDFFPEPNIQVPNFPPLSNPITSGVDGVVGPLPTDPFASAKQTNLDPTNVSNGMPLPTEFKSKSEVSSLSKTDQNYVEKGNPFPLQPFPLETPPTSEKNKNHIPITKPLPTDPLSDQQSNPWDISSLPDFSSLTKPTVENLVEGAGLFPNDPSAFPIPPTTDPFHIPNGEQLPIDAQGNMGIPSLPKTEKSYVPDGNSSPVDISPLKPSSSVKTSKKDKKVKKNIPSTEPLPSDPFGVLAPSPFDFFPEPNIQDPNFPPLTNPIAENTVGEAGLFPNDPLANPLSPTTDPFKVPNEQLSIDSQGNMGIPSLSKADKSYVSDGNPSPLDISPLEPSSSSKTGKESKRGKKGRKNKKNRKKKPTTERLLSDPFGDLSPDPFDFFSEPNIQDPNFPPSTNPINTGTHNGAGPLPTDPFGITQQASLKSSSGTPLSKEIQSNLEVPPLSQTDQNYVPKESPSPLQPVPLKTTTISKNDKNYVPTTNSLPTDPFSNPQINPWDISFIPDFSPLTKPIAENTVGEAGLFPNDPLANPLSPTTDPFQFPNEQLPIDSKSNTGIPSLSKADKSYISDGNPSPLDISPLEPSSSSKTGKGSKRGRKGKKGKMNRKNKPSTEPQISDPFGDLSPDQFEPFLGPNMQGLDFPPLTNPITTGVDSGPGPLPTDLLTVTQQLNHSPLTKPDKSYVSDGNPTSIDPFPLEIPSPSKKGKRGKIGKTKLPSSNPLVSSDLSNNPFEILSEPNLPLDIPSKDPHDPNYAPKDKISPLSNKDPSYKTEENPLVTNSQTGVGNLLESLSQLKSDPNYIPKEKPLPIDPFLGDSPSLLIKDQSYVSKEPSKPFSQNPVELGKPSHIPPSPIKDPNYAPLTEPLSTDLPGSLTEILSPSLDKQNSDYVPPKNVDLSPGPLSDPVGPLSPSSSIIKDPNYVEPSSKNDLLPVITDGAALSEAHLANDFPGSPLGQGVSSDPTGLSNSAMNQFQEPGIPPELQGLSEIFDIAQQKAVASPGSLDQRRKNQKVRSNSSGSYVNPKTVEQSPSKPAKIEQLFDPLETGTGKDIIRKAVKKAGRKTKALMKGKKKRKTASKSYADIKRSYQG